MAGEVIAIGLLVLAAIVGVRQIVKARKNGGVSCGCGCSSGCAGCNGSLSQGSESAGTEGELPPCCSKIVPRIEG